MLKHTSTHTHIDRTRTGPSTTRDFSSTIDHFRACLLWIPESGATSLYWAVTKGCQAILIQFPWNEKTCMHRTRDSMVIRQLWWNCSSSSRDPCKFRGAVSNQIPPLLHVEWKRRNKLYMLGIVTDQVQFIACAFGDLRRLFPTCFRAG